MRRNSICEQSKKVASHIFIDGFGGMTQGLFATLIIGTMIQQIGLLIGGSTGNVIYLLGKAAAALTSAVSVSAWQ